MNDMTTLTPDVQTWSFESWNVRTVTIDGEPWFVGKDVCDALEILKPENAIPRLDDDERMKISRDILTTLSEGGQKSGRGGAQHFTIINESGLYSLIMTSRKQEAKRFKKWVTSEVLPTIRKTGSYGQPAIPTNMAEALRLAADEHERAKQLAIASQRNHRSRGACKQGAICLLARCS